ncbi:hypothetical protein [Terrisporobacter vanillatitrophus]|uniref:hypothetical protein n=1 Tax=Terrisporobacter vanillatitrophus TaxID=3058402 RepID=UPI003366A38E
MAKMLKSKYNSTGERCVDACLNYGELRYVNNDGSPIKIEIPCDKYEEAISDFLERIKEGLTADQDIDPSKVLKRGTITYNQARDISYEGKIKGIEIFAIDESIECDHVLGISASIEYALAIWNGDSRETALKKSVIRAITVYGEDFIKELELTEIIGEEEFSKFCDKINYVKKINSLDLYKPLDVMIDDDIGEDDDLTTKKKLMKNIKIASFIAGLTLAIIVMQIITNGGTFKDNLYLFLPIFIISLTMSILVLFYIRISKYITEQYTKNRGQTIMEMFNEELERIIYDNILTEKECKVILHNITKGEISKLLLDMKGSVNKKLSCNALVKNETRFILDERKSIVLPSEMEVKKCVEKFMDSYKEKFCKDEAAKTT